MFTPEAIQAADWVSDLIRLESRGPGDTENAMRRLSSRHGIEYGQLWSLRYRKPRRIWADIYGAIRAARDAEIRKQIGRLEHDLEISRQVAGPDHSAVREVEALVAAHKKPRRSA